ncbi:MAG: 16S rRNA (cytosine(967)-C(5))-methyltransferase RsmB [Eubacteriaceae bacterium]|nr:16S rRNA (cytosine(967)-C(5))-methyltransferase RsmB [Eubacteriaceae bacterium]
MKISPARLAAYKALCEIYTQGAFSNQAIDRHTRNIASNADARLASQIVYGTIKKANKIDKAILSLSRQKNAQENPYAKIAVSMGIYQMLFLDKTPDYAIVNDAVNIAKTFITNSIASYTNAILRNCARNRAELRQPEASYEGRLFYDYGISPELYREFRAYMAKPDVEALGIKLQEPPTLFIRANTLKTTPRQLINALSDIGISAYETYAPGTLQVSSGQRLFKSDLFKQGHFFVQDLSGAISTYALGPQPRDSIIDVCAAPGAKSFGAYLLGNGPKVYSSDINSDRLDMLYRNSKQLGINVKTLRRDAAAPCREQESYSKVICDVPCTGLGVIARKPEIAHSFTKEKQQPLIELQSSILKNSFDYLKPAGRLLYSTCTLSKAENEGIVQSFLSQAPNVRTAQITLPFDLQAPHEEMKEGMLLLNPAKDGCDGFFMCLLEKVPT